jgi:Na+:H+ antiporter, NhaA family
LASALALIVANSPLHKLLRAAARAASSDPPGRRRHRQATALWINDGLMTVFFLLVGLEIKRELMDGDLVSREQAILPGIAALGGSCRRRSISYSTSAIRKV